MGEFTVGRHLAQGMPYFPQAGPISPASGISPQAMGDTWSNLFASIDPVFLSMFGTAFGLGLSVLGAAWGIFLTGSSLLGAAINVPRIRSKNLISIIFCEALAIYGVIIAIISATKVDPAKTKGAWLEQSSQGTYLTNYAAGMQWDPQMVFCGYAVFAAGITVGLANL